MSTELVMPSNHLILCHPLLLLPSIFPSLRVFSNESALHIRWPKYWSFSINISPSKEHPGLISFRMDWLDLLAVQGTLKSLLQHHSSKASILWHSAFFIVQLSHPYMTTGKTIAWTAAAANSIQSCLTLCNSMNRRTPGLPVHHQLQNSLRLTSIESVMPSSHLILSRPLLLPPIPPSIKVFSNESTFRMRWPKYWSFCFNISPSNEHPGLSSFRMDWLDLLAVQGTPKSLLQHHSSKASILWHLFI